MTFLVLLDFAGRPRVESPWAPAQIRHVTRRVTLHTRNFVLERPSKQTANRFHANIGRLRKLALAVTQHPHAMPSVWETGGRIPREIDRHVFDDGSLCLG